MTTKQTNITPGPERRYREALASGVFQIQKCQECSKHVFYPRALCTHCGSATLAWVAPSGRGTVYSTTVVRRKPEEGGDLNVALIDLDEGVRLMSRVEGIRPEEVRIGLAVEARIARQADDTPLLVFDAREQQS